jgi:phage-related protein
MVAARGPALVVAYIEVAHNEFPAKQYLDQLRAERGDAYHAAVLHLFKWIADHGRIQNIEKFRQLDDGIVEFKHHQARVLGFFEPGGFLMLTHGFTKQQAKTPPTEIARAKRIRDEYRSKKPPRT